MMWLDGGGFRKAHKLQGAKSIGLATLLDDEQQQQQQQQNGKKVGVVVVVSASCCMQEGGSCSSNRRWGLDRTLAYVLDMSPHAPDIPFFITKDDKIDFPKVRSYLNAQLEDGIMHDDSSDDGSIASGSRDGVLINAAGGARPVGDNDVVVVVAMDSESASGDIRFDQSHLVLESQTVFSSARANACVWKGRWMFEATLGTAGIQQLGWATVSCPFTCEEGVGDAVDSYAYDGKRVRKWSKGPKTYGQPWVAGDVIGCCIDLDIGEISFYRNGFPLGVAYEGVRTLEPRQGYFPAISLSHSERCELNFGGRPFKYPVQGFFPIQAPPVVKFGEAQDRLGSATARAKFLLGCLQRLVQLSSHEVAAAMAPVDRLRRLIPLSEDDISSLGGEICELLWPLLLAGGLETKEEKDDATDDVRQPNQYVVWAALVPFLLETYRREAPHDAPSVDRALDLLLPQLVDKQVADSSLISMLMEVLAYGCRTSPFSLADHPYTGPYPYLALACHLLERYDFMVLWWMSKGFDLCLEGLLTRKGPNKNDLEALMPTVWWPGSREDLCSEGKLRHAATTLSKAIDKVEELQWELFRQLLQFVPPSSGELQQQVPGVVLRRFLQHLVCKNRGANRSMAPPGLSDNSVLVSTYCVLLRLLSEGLGNGKVGAESVEGTKEHSEHSVGFLHREGKRSFPVHLFLKDGSSTDFSRLGGTLSHLIKTYPVGLDSPKVEWVESSMDGGDELVRHGGKLQPACCSEVVMGGLGRESKSPAQAATKIVTSSLKTGVSERAASPLSNDHNGHSCDGCEEGKPCSSGRIDISLQGATVFRSTYKRAGFQPIMELSEAIREEELLDIMVLLYHLGLAQNFKQASFCMQHQMQSITQLDDTDRSICGEKLSGDYLKPLKEARTLYREDLIDFVRQCTWYRVTMFARWKLRGMYATCMWLVQLLLMLSKHDPLFSYVPEYYVETLVDSFHALRRSDPPFVSPSSLLQQGLSPFVTFLVTHFNDVRIVNLDIRDILLQSISVLVQYKDHVVAFERSQAACVHMVGSLLASFDNRFWIPISNILLRLCKGSGFGASKCSSHGESFSPHFQRLLKEKCTVDEKLFASFLNRLFNTLNWTITEFSVVIKEMQEQIDRHQVQDLQQRKCTIMFELSCNLERILEFFTQELPMAFLQGPEMNLTRLCELIVFVLNHTTCSADALYFDSSVRQQGQSLDKVHRAMILAPLVGIVLNLRSAMSVPNHGMTYDLAHAIVSMDRSAAVISNFQYLISYSWDVIFKGDPSVRRVEELKAFVSKLKAEWEEVKRQVSEEELHELLTADLCSDVVGGSSAINREETCSICYACEVDTMFIPCQHQSCQRCISRHLLNNQRCFFCNSPISELCNMIPTTPYVGDSPCPADSTATLTQSTTGYDLQQSHSIRMSISRLQ